MSGWWQAMLSGAAQSRGALWKFGGQVTVVSIVAGVGFSYLTAPNNTPDERKKHVDGLNYDTQRFANAQQERLSHMLREQINGGSTDAHWDAAMKGTLKPHPKPENKTHRADSERADFKTA